MQTGSCVGGDVLLVNQGEAGVKKAPAQTTQYGSSMRALALR